MKYSTRGLLTVVAVAAVMIAMLRVPSPLSVLVVLVSVCGILMFTARASFKARGPTQRLFLGASALAGFAYLTLYVALDSPVEAWLNHELVIPFAVFTLGPDAEFPDPGDLDALARTMEFQYFQQKMHLLLSIVAAFTTGLMVAACDDDVPQASDRKRKR